MKFDNSKIQSVVQGNAKEILAYIDLKGYCYVRGDAKATVLRMALNQTVDYIAEAICDLRTGRYREEYRVTRRLVQV